jgi:transcriptional regulator with XRE-family HTH domain
MMLFSWEKPMERAELAKARYSKGWSQEKLAETIGVSRNTISQWERGLLRPYPIHVHKLCEVFGKTAEELGLIQTIASLSQSSSVAMPSVAIEEFLPQCAATIAVCGALGDQGKRDDMALAAQVITTFLPVLRTIVNDSSRHRQTAAALASKVLQMKQRLAYHLEGIEQALLYAEHAVTYARESTDATTIVMALRELASVYEWPMEHMRAHDRRRKSLELTEEADHFLEKYGATVSPLVQSWVYIGLAKFQALNGLEQKTYCSIGKAQEVFALSSNEEMPGFHLDEANLIRQESIAYAYLRQQEKALNSFLQLVDVNNEHIAAKVPMPARTHLGALSEVTFSSLKLPQAKKDKDLSKRLWKAELQLADVLHSETYLDEVRIAYRVMESVWSDDAEILDLRDLIEA